MHQPFIILVTGSPTASQAHLSAIRFANASLESGHKIASIFFYQDAVQVANRFTLKPQDEAQLQEQWIKLSQENEIELQVCVAAGNRRGIINGEEASQHQLDSSSIHSSFQVLGLGQLASALGQSDLKLVQFK